MKEESQMISLTILFIYNRKLKQQIRAVPTNMYLNQMSNLYQQYFILKPFENSHVREENHFTTCD